MREVELVEATDEPGRSRSGLRDPVPAEVEDDAPPTTSARPGPGCVSTPAGSSRRSRSSSACWPSPSSSSTAARTPGRPRSPPSRASCRRSTRPIGVLWRADPELATGAPVRVGGGRRCSSGARRTRPAPRRSSVSTPPRDRSRGAPRWTCRCPGRARRARRRSCGSRARRVPHGERPRRGLHRPAVRRGCRGHPCVGPSGCSTRPTATLLADREVDGRWGLTFVDDALVVARPAAGAPGRWEVRATDVVSGEHPLDLDDLAGGPGARARPAARRPCSRPRTTSSSSSTPTPGS